MKGGEKESGIHIETHVGPVSGKKKKAQDPKAEKL